MKYRIRVDAWIINDVDLLTIKNMLNKLIPKITNITNSRNKIERAVISYHKCYHEEGKSCPKDIIVWEKK